MALRSSVFINVNGLNVVLLHRLVFFLLAFGGLFLGVGVLANFVDAVVGGMELRPVCGDVYRAY